VERVPTEVPSRAENRRYLQTKKERMAHLLTLDIEAALPTMHHSDND
jgi:GTP cyclohydrolase II